MTERAGELFARPRVHSLGGDGGDATAKGDVHGFNRVPIRKGSVGNDQGVGVPDAGEEMEVVGGCRGCGFLVGSR